jgi:hypothetical protein
MKWKPIAMMDDADITAARIMALQAGFDPDDLTGAWMCNMDAPGDEGRYGYYGRIVSGNITSYAGTGFQGDDAGIGQPVLSGDFVIDREEEDSNGGFNWLILLVFGALFLLIVLITIIRYPSHWKEPEPEEEKTGIRRNVYSKRRVPDGRRGRRIDSLKGSNRRR